MILRLTRGLYQLPSAQLDASHSLSISAHRNRFVLKGAMLYPLQVSGLQRTGLMRHRQALLNQRDELLLAQPLAPAGQRRMVERQVVAEPCSPQKYR